MSESTKQERPLFELGSLYASPAAIKVLQEKSSITDVLNRHARGDWSEMVEADQRLNQHAVKSGAHVFSQFLIAGEELWVLTDAQRRSTKILLSEQV